MAELTTRETSTFKITPMKPDGSPGEVDAASVVVASSDETIIRIVGVNATNSAITGKVQPVAASDSAARFTVTADADLGAGVSTITGVSEDIAVKQDPADMASGFTIVLDPPVPIA